MYKKKSKALMTWSDDEDYDSFFSEESDEDMVNLAIVLIDDDSE